MKGIILYFCKKFLNMKSLYQNFEEQLRKTTLDFKRYLYRYPNHGI